MKNISRRSFIKGVAVASLAVAASTVLTGCTLPVGTESKDEATGFQPVTQVTEINNEDFILSVTGYQYDNDSKVLAVNVTATNYSDKAVTITNTEPTTGVYATALAYADAETNLDDADLAQATFGKNGVSLWNKTVPEKVGASAGVATGSLYFNVGSEYKDWKAVTMTVSIADATDTEPATIENADLTFVINR